MTESDFTGPLNRVAEVLSLPEEILDIISLGFNQREAELLGQISIGDYEVSEADSRSLNKLLSRHFVLLKEGKFQLNNGHDFVGYYILFYRDTIDEKSAPVFESYFSRDISAHHIKTYEQTRKLMAHSPGFWVIDCVCRVLNGNCSHPIKICMGLVKSCEIEGTQRISYNEALKIAAEAEERNLVPTYFEIQDDEGWLCFCCGCCCIPIRQFLKNGENAVQGDYIEYTEFEVCTACGDCVEACQFSARGIVDDELMVDKELCMGCGVCVDDCQYGVISMELRVGSNV